MSIQEHAIRKSQRDHQKHVGEIAMLRGEAERQFAGEHGAKGETVLKRP